MNIVAKVDEALISRVFEPISWQSEYRWSAGSPRLSRIATTTVFVSCALGSLADGRYIAAALLGLFSFFYDMFCGAREERMQIHFRSFGLPNPMRPLWDFRLKFLLLYIAMLAPIVIMTGYAWSTIAVATSCIVFSAISRWFDACESMPPSFKKEQEAKDAERSMQTSEI